MPCFAVQFCRTGGWTSWDLEETRAAREPKRWRVEGIRWPIFGLFGQASSPLH